MNVYISMLTTQTLKNWVLGQRHEYTAEPAKVGKEINTRLGETEYAESKPSGRLAESNPIVCNEQAWWEPKNAKQHIWWLWEISDLRTIRFQCLGVKPAYTSSYRQDELQENGVIKWKHSKKIWKQLSLPSFSSLLGLLIWSLQHFKYINLPTLWNITLTYRH